MKDDGDVKDCHIVADDEEDVGVTGAVKSQLQQESAASSSVEDSSSKRGAMVDETIQIFILDENEKTIELRFL